MSEVTPNLGSPPDGRRWAAAFPVILLLVVASAQVAAATLGHLTPWKGGGFGMFASLDGPTTRFLIVTAIDAAGRQHVVLLPGGSDSDRPELTPLYRTQLMVFPTSSRLRRLAGRVLHSRAVLGQPRSRRQGAAIAATEVGAQLYASTPDHTVVELVSMPDVGSELTLVSVTASILRWSLTADRSAITFQILASETADR